MTSSVQKCLQQKNAAYASQFSLGDLALPPAKKYLIVTCMDARIDPADAAFDIALGDAHVIRNAHSCWGREGDSAGEAHGLRDS
ncbi:hypothetical protein F5Y15DRAFT_422350 [Xylariaceae sp. FL0016]|nr:hypothetical protein F5Y15DRAFT_422350 [Xylariaceae sp. FL0016]